MRHRSRLGCPRHSCSLFRTLILRVKTRFLAVPWLERLTRLELSQVTDFACDLLSPPNEQRWQKLLEFRSLTLFAPQRLGAKRRSGCKALITGRPRRKRWA